jgi:D-alanine-D-alanine ligase
MMGNKKRVAVLFGGRSSEHDVSLMSAANVVAAIDRDRYEIELIGITKSGEWLSVALENGRPPKAIPPAGTRLALLPGGSGRLVAIPADGSPFEMRPVDVVFPVLHGLFGEDGSVQGHAEVAGLAYVGCGVLGSAAAMDKDIAKSLLSQAGLKVARSTTLRRGEKPSFETLSKELGLPLFVKPARQGSSVGVGKARNETEFRAVLKEAFRYDDKVLVEECLDGREIECAILETVDGDLLASIAGEIVPAESHGFYSYDAKYIDADGAALKIPAELSPAALAELQNLSRRAFRALSCEGMARVDFFLRPDGAFYINEVNTIPGFTNISMYPKLFEASGIGNRELVTRLIEHALARAGRVV